MDEFLYISCDYVDIYTELIIYHDKEEAIKNSKEWPTLRYDIFYKKDKQFVPTHTYLLNGEIKNAR